MLSGGLVVDRLLPVQTEPMITIRRGCRYQPPDGGVLKSQPAERFTGYQCRCRYYRRLDPTRNEAECKRATSFVYEYALDARSDSSFKLGEKFMIYFTHRWHQYMVFELFWFYSATCIAVLVFYFLRYKDQIKRGGGRHSKCRQDLCFFAHNRLGERLRYRTRIALLSVMAQLLHAPQQRDARLAAYLQNRSWSLSTKLSNNSIDFRLVSEYFKKY